MKRKEEQVLVIQRDALKSRSEEDTQGKIRRKSQKTNCWYFEPFKTKHLAIIQYICIWTFLYLLVHHSSSKSIRNKSGVLSDAVFNTIVELIKMTFSAALFLRSNSSQDLSSFLFSRKMVSLSLKYLPVAILYALYNNLMFFNLRSNYPSVFLVLSNSKLIMMAVAWQLVFNVQILPIRKIAILVILVGILAKDLFGKESKEITGDREEGGGPEFFLMSTGTILILVQMMCSVIASVYNEKLLKTNHCNWLLQNISLCMNSVVINLVICITSSVLRQGDGFDIASEMRSMSSPTSILIVLTMATAGLMTSMVIRHVDSVTKSVASATETVLTAVIEYIFFDHFFMMPEIIGIVLVSAGSVLYSIPASSFRFLDTRESSSTTKRSLKFRNETARYRKPAILQLLLPLFLTMFVCFGASMHLVSRDGPQEDNLKNIYGSTIAKERALSPEFKKGHDVARLQHPAIEKERISTALKEGDDRAMRRQRQRVGKGQEVVAFIVKELQKINAPVSLMYGTMLHEYRNGTGPTILPNIQDKDFDIAVFRKHFYHIVGMQDRIKSDFGFKVKYLNKDRLVMVLLPPGQIRVGKGFQIDIYGFDVDNPRKGLTLFPWDSITVATNSLLPLAKHKPLLGVAELGANGTALISEDPKDLLLYMPFNVPCILSNLYGEDYMTPKDGHDSDRKEAYDHPPCNDKVLSVIERNELTRQLSFAGDEYQQEKKYLRTRNKKFPQAKIE